MNISLFDNFFLKCLRYASVYIDHVLFSCNNIAENCDET